MQSKKRLLIMLGSAAAVGAIALCACVVAIVLLLEPKVSKDSPEGVIKAAVEAASEGDSGGFEDLVRPRNTDNLVAIDQLILTCRDRSTDGVEIRVEYPSDDTARIQLRDVLNTADFSLQNSDGEWYITRIEFNSLGCPF